MQTLEQKAMQNKRSVITENQEIFTDAEAQEFLRISRITLWELCRAGQLPFYTIGKRILYKREDLENLLKPARLAAAA